MSALAQTPYREPLAGEFERIVLLGQCLSEMRQGREIDAELLERLREAQHRVEQARAQGLVWQGIGKLVPSPLAYDVLACAVAAEAEPRIGWMFQNLQPGAPQPYPTPALIQELLALSPYEANELYELLAEGSPLRRMDLISMEGVEPYQPLRPGSGLTTRLLGRSDTDDAPPGAVRVAAAWAWDSLILPEDRLGMLREFLWWIQYRDRVVHEWGGASIGGPIALFAGPSGTGKTFAASVLATELGWALYRVDLGRLVSKYIGETEKNLNRLFDAAHGREMVLQFDEADALFAKRGEVKEARDRYANMEVSHLLARIESHQGPCILTTNMRRNMDQAFARRFQAVVDFPRPDAAARARLWRAVLPGKAPMKPDVNPEFLGKAINLTGGNIRNAALHAAYLAAATSGVIGLSHIALAVWRELAKDGRELNKTDLGTLASYMPGEPLC